MSEPPEAVLAIDPGRGKWGLAVVLTTGECVLRDVVAADVAPSRAAEIASERGISRVLLGDRTGARAALERLRALSTEPVLVPEHGTTLIARDLYWRDHPIRGWRRWLPRGLLTPPEPLDGYAAEATALRHLGILEREGGRGGEGVKG